MKTRRKVAARMNQKVSKPELITILSGTFLCMLNQFLISPALPAIMNQYGITTGVVQWLTNGFTMVCALLVPMSAFLIRKYAIRNLFLFSMILFMGGSVLIGSGGMFLFVLAGRILQAIGAGIMVPISQVYLLNAFPKEKRGNAMGMMALVIAAAPAFGPVIAGVTIDHFGWYWMFRAMALAAATVLVTAWIVLKTGRGESSLRIDWYSVICSCLGFGGILYGLSAASDAGIAAPEVLVSLAGGSLFLVLFVRRQNSSEDPFLKLNVLNVDSFRTGVILIFIANACLAGGTVLIPVFVQNICGCSATTSGMIMAPGAILMGILGSIAGRVYDKKGPRGLSITGFVLLTLGNFSFCFAGSAWPAVLTGVLYTLRMAGVALINTPVMTWAMNDLSKEELPHGVSVFHTFRQMSGSIGTVIMVLVMGLVESAGGHTPVSAIRGLSAAFALISVIGMAGLILAIRKER